MTENETGTMGKETGMTEKAAGRPHSSPECQLRIPYPSAARAGSLALTSWVMTRLA